LFDFYPILIFGLSKYAEPIAVIVALSRALSFFSYISFNSAFFLAMSFAFSSKFDL